VFLGVAVACLVFGGNSVSEVSARDGGERNLFSELKVFTDVLAIVQRDYVRPVDNRKMVEGAIKGLLATLDPHSGYLDPDFYQDLQVQTRGEFGGLGIEITIRDGVLIVVSPMEGAPAASAGIRSGDEIVKIDGRFTKEFSLVDAVKRLRGPKGSTIVLSIHRKGVNELIDIPIQRDNIMVKSVRSRYLGEGYGYVRISQFMEKTTEDLKKALAGLHAQAAADKSSIVRPDGSYGTVDDLRGLVIDMRNNPGGLLTQAIGVSDLFLNEGVIVYTDGRIESQKQKYYAHPRGIEPAYPIIVIVNGGSASASEIVAGALKDHGRALILGNQTFGKGSVQTVTPLENGGAITLTTALYYTKSGRSIQLTGVKPDVEVADSRVVEPPPVVLPKNEDGPDLMREGDLPGAIENPSGSNSGSPLQRLNKTPTVGAPLKALDIEKDDLGQIMKGDGQLSRAFDLLKTFNILGVNRESAPLQSVAG